MPKEVEGKNVGNSVVPNNDEELDEEGCCRCCHCGSGQEDIKNQNYLKMREHLQQRLKAKNNVPNSACDSSTGSRSSSSHCNIDAYAELDYLVKYIEGHDDPPKGGVPNPKRAAKKARQKERKLEKRRAEELAAKEAANKPPSLPASSKLPQDRVPNGMVRITHNPLTNSAVITPLYGPLEPNPSYLQQPLGLSQPVKSSPPSNPVPIDPPRPSPISVPKGVVSPVQQQNSSGQVGSTSSSSQPQQMVTIRRVMQPNLSEPVVTVTLKGETPDNDRVLFTLVNGQVLPTDKASNPKPGNATGVSSLSPQVSSTAPPQTSETTRSPTSSQSRRKQKKQEKKKLKRQNLKAANNVEPLFQAPITEQLQSSSITTTYKNQQQDFTLDNFRLPPGITLTRVQGSHTPVHPELPMRLVDRTKRENGTSGTNSSSPGSNPIIVTSPLNAPKSKESLGSLGGLAAPNVIVVDTRKIQQQPASAQQQHRTVQTCSVGVQTGEDDVDQDQCLKGTALTKQQRKKLRRKEKLKEEEAVLEQLAVLEINSTSKKVNNGGKKDGSAFTTATAKVLDNQVKSQTFQVAGRGSGKATSTTELRGTNGGCNPTGGKSGKKKKKSRPSASAQTSEDKWEENVFVPKSDLDLEGGDLDDDERELEAFKRFCFNTVPPERKEKVRIHLNVKDIFGKKSNGLHMTSCK